jgi:3-dehydroquinate synthase
LGLALNIDLLDIDSMWQALLDRVEHRNGAQHVPLPAGLGHSTFVNNITVSEISSSIHTLSKRMAKKNDSILEF